MRTASLVTVFVFFAQVVLGQAVSSVSGSISDDGSITISGSGFGTGATIFLWDDFDDDSDGTPINSASPNIGTTASWGTWDSSAEMTNTVSDIVGYGASGNSMRIPLNNGTNSTWGMAGVVNTTPTSTVYVSFNRYLRCGASESPDNHKLTIWYGNGEGGRPQFQSPIWTGTSTAQYYNNCGNSGSWFNQFFSISWSGQRESWHRWEWYTELNDPYSSDNDVAEFYHDLTELYSSSSTQLRGCMTEDADWDEFDFGQYTNSDAAYDSLINYFDDIIVQSSRARVELGDNSSWASCTVRDYQPHTSWSATEITVTVNQGSFAEDDAAYLFVVDADGNVSDGYAVTIGASESASITAPTSLTANKVE